MTHNDDNLPENPDLSFNEGKKRPFGMPADYFASFEEKLKEKMEMADELNAFPLLASLQKKNVFVFPTDYFLQTEQSLEHSTELVTYSHLQSIAKPLAEDLDEAYTKKLTTSLSYRISLVDELKPYQTLYAMDKTAVFSVTDDYFDTLAERVKAHIFSGDNTKQSVLDKVLDAVFGKRTAWAFGLALIIGLAIYFKPEEESIQAGNDCKTLACLEKHEILDNKAMTSLDEDQLIDLVDVNSLGKQLNLEEERKDTLSGRKIRLRDVETEQLLDAL